MFVCPVDDNEVFNLLNKLDKSKSSGPNSIPTNLLKNHAPAFFLPQFPQFMPIFQKRGEKFERIL